MAKLPNVFTFLIKHNAEQSASDIEALLKKNYRITTLGHVSVDLTLSEAIELTNITISDKASRQLASLAALAMTGRNYLVGAVAEGVNSQQEVFGLTESIQVTASQTGHNNSLGTFPVNYPPASDLDLLTEAAQLVVDQDRIILPVNLVALDALEGLVTSSGFDLNALYYCCDKEPSNYQLNEIAPGIWHSERNGLVRKALEAGLCYGPKHFQKASQIARVSDYHFSSNRAFYELVECLMVGCVDEDEKQRLLNGIRNFHSTPKVGNIAIDIEALRQAVKMIDDPGKQSILTDIRPESKSIIKEALLLAEGKPPLINTLRPVIDSLWLVERLSEADRTSGDYLTEADFSIEIREKGKPNQGPAIFRRLAWYILYAANARQPIDKDLWSQAYSAIEAKYRWWNRNQDIAVLSTQAVYDLLEEMRAGLHVDGIGPKRLELLNRMFGDDDIAGSLS